MFLNFMLPDLFSYYSPVLKLITAMESIGDITCKYKVVFYYETCKLDLISLSEALSALVLSMIFFIRTLKMILIISTNVCLLVACMKKSSAQQSPKLSKLEANQLFLSGKTTTLHKKRSM